MIKKILIKITLAFFLFFNTFANANDIAGMADIIIGKQRHGPTGNVHVEFEGMYTKFKDRSKN